MMIARVVFSDGSIGNADHLKEYVVQDWAHNVVEDGLITVYNEDGVPVVTIPIDKVFSVLVQDDQR